MIILVFFFFLDQLLVRPKFTSFQEVKRSKGDEVEEGEIVENVENVEKGLDFSDSDMSQEELCFLPASPTYNVPELTEKLIRSSPESVDSNNSSPSGGNVNH